MTDEPPAVLPNQVPDDDPNEMPFEPEEDQEEGGGGNKGDDWNPVT